MSETWRYDLSTVSVGKLADTINEASCAAMNLIYEYASRFPNREDYEPLEQLASDVQHAVVEVATKQLDAPDYWET